MVSAVPILLFLAGLFLLVMFALAMGILSREQEREQERKEAEERAARPALGSLTGPRFFAKLGPNGDSALPSGARSSVVDALERYLGREQVGARRFAAEPSAASLFRNGDRRAGAVVGRLESYLQGERRLAEGFGHDAGSQPTDRAGLRVPGSQLLPWMPGEGTSGTATPHVPSADGGGR